MLINLISITVNLTLSIFIMHRLKNIINICFLFNNYFVNKLIDPDHIVLSKCSKLTLLFIFWLVLNLICLLLKFVSINLSYRSHTLVKKLKKRKKNKKTY